MKRGHLYSSVWHHRLNGHDFKQAPGAGDGQGSLVAQPGVAVRQD